MKRFAPLILGVLSISALRSEQSTVGFHENPANRLDGGGAFAKESAITPTNVAAPAVMPSVSAIPAEESTLGFDDNPADRRDGKNVPATEQAHTPPAAAIPTAAAAPTVFVQEAAVFPEAIRPRGALRFDFGDGVGYANGYIYVESFLPLYEDPGRWLLFNNLRVVNFQNADLWELNVGFGLRRFNSATERVFGIHAEYDGRTTLNNNYFNQVTIGWESLGQRVDVRNNFYVPVGTREVEIGQAASVFDPRFFQHNIIFSRNRFFEGTLGGFDFEAGGLLAGASSWNLRGYLGYYHYSGNGLRDIDGIRGRLEANIGSSMSVYLQAQNDAVNDTMVSGGVAFFFGPGKASRGVPGASPYARMGERIVRDPNIMTGSQTKVVPEVALDAETGKPILVRHANSSATAGGDGTFEHPYRTLSDLQAGSIPRDILFVHANSVLNNQAIVLQDRQRFLGEGLAHTFASKQGVFLLPRATAGTLLPIIQSSAGDMVTLANRVEVAGFQLNDAGRDAIFGRFASDVYLHDLAIANAARHGVRLVDVGGTNVLQNASIFGVGGSGVSIRLNEDTIGTYLLRDIAIANAGQNGVALRLRDSSQAYLDLANSSIASVGRSGIVVALHDASKARFDLLNTTITSAARDGVRGVTDGTSALTANVKSNELQDIGRDGVFFVQKDDSSVTATIDSNKVNSASRSQLGAELRNQSTGNYTFTNNELTGASNVGIDVHASNQSRVYVLAADNTIDNGDFAGMHFDSWNRARIVADIRSNVLRGGENGLALTLDDLSKATFSIVGNQISDTFESGIFVDAFGRSSIEAEIIGNTIRRSGLFGINANLFNQSTGSFLMTGNTLRGNDFAGIFLDVHDRTALATSINDNTIRGSDVGLVIVQSGRSYVDALVAGNTFRFNQSAQIGIDIADQSTGDYQIRNNTLQNTFGRGVDVFVATRPDVNEVVNMTLTGNSISGSFLGGVSIETSDKTRLNALLEDNKIFANFFGGVRFTQYDQSNVTARLARNQIFNNGVAHVAIDTFDRSSGVYQFAFNTLTGGFAAAVRAESHNKSKLDMQLFGNTVNRFVILRESDSSTFRREKTLFTNVGFPFFFLVDPAIEAKDDLGFPPP